MKGVEVRIGRGGRFWSVDRLDLLAGVNGGWRDTGYEDIAASSSDSDMDIILRGRSSSISTSMVVCGRRQGTPLRKSGRSMSIPVVGKRNKLAKQRS